MEDKVLDYMDDVQNLLGEIKALCPDIKGFEFKLNIKDGYDIDDEYVEFSDYPFGLIDHQSQDLLYNEDLTKIIFNKGCLIVIDNDNSDYYDWFNPMLKPGKNENVKRYPDSRYTSTIYNITEEDFEE